MQCQYGLEAEHYERYLMHLRDGLHLLVGREILVNCIPPLRMFSFPLHSLIRIVVAALECRSAPALHYGASDGSMLCEKLEQIQSIITTFYQLARNLSLT